MDNKTLLINLMLSLLVTVKGGPIEDLAKMPDLYQFYQQVIRQPELKMILQGTGKYSGGDLTIFAPTNDAMSRLGIKSEDPNILWKYHIVAGRYSDQTLFNMATEKFNQGTSKQLSDQRLQNNLPTMALPFQVFYGTGFYGGSGPHLDNKTNVGYASRGISWLTHSAFNQSNYKNNNPNYMYNTPQVRNWNNPINYNRNYVVAQGPRASNNRNLFPPNLMNYYTNVFNPNTNAQLQNTYVGGGPMMNKNYNPVVQAGIGVQKPTINNAFILQTRGMSRGVINVIDAILWPPERRDQTQYKTAYDILEDNTFSKLRELVARNNYLQAELRSQYHQTWFLPTNQAFQSSGSSLNYFFDPAFMNTTQDVVNFLKAHTLPLVVFPSNMDSTKQLMTLNGGKLVTFRKVKQPDGTFQFDVVADRQVSRILSSRPEDIKFYGNGLVFPINNVLGGPARTAADELARSYQYFMALVQQSGDTELMNLLQGSPAGLGNTPTSFNPYNQLNITILIPQQMSISQLGKSQELSTNLRRHILRLPVYVEQIPTNYQADQFFNQMQQQQQQQQFINNPFRSGQISDRKNYLSKRKRRQILVNPNINRQFQQPGFPRQEQQQGFIQNIPPQNYPQIHGQQFFSQQPNNYRQQEQQQLQSFQLNDENLHQQYPMYSSPIIFQDGQTYQTYDPSFSIQAQVSNGPHGNIVTLTGRSSSNSAPFQATILNSESNLPVRNGVMHIIRGLLSGTVTSMDTVLNQLQGVSLFNQFLQQTNIINELKNSGRSYTLFMPTNRALTQIGVTANTNKLRQFVQRHICADTLLDPLGNNIARKSEGFYSGQRQQYRPPLMMQQQPSKEEIQYLQRLSQASPISLKPRRHAVYMKKRKRRQDHAWFQALQGGKKWSERLQVGSHAGFISQIRNASYRRPIGGRPDLGPAYFQPDQQVHGGYPAAPSSYAGNNQLYNPGSYTRGGYGQPNSQYPPYNSNYYRKINYPYNQGQYWNNGTMNIQSNQPNPGKNYNKTVVSGPSIYNTGYQFYGAPQSCRALSGDQITVRQVQGASQSQGSYMVTCCGDISISAMVQSFNIYPPGYAVYTIGKALLSYGQTVNNLYSDAIRVYSYNYFLLLFTILFVSTIKHTEKIL
ncbi:unnamed protein product [Didymodactylos carnosus]|uniref:FAS1 domain-containing protein n=1 Tax=Didymodactylos carnosus TaxID=1234261 RepID=A0A8S2H8J3_9BILA|nr:unnamed protein product [Didymodactylos carnosus]CAF3615332.1 unnamed protein product [Didymodactylos carnosus]